MKGCIFPGENELCCFNCGSLLQDSSRRQSNCTSRCQAGRRNADNPFACQNILLRFIFPLHDWASFSSSQFAIKLRWSVCMLIWAGNCTGCVCVSSQVMKMEREVCTQLLAILGRSDKECQAFICAGFRYAWLAISGFSYTYQAGIFLFSCIIHFPDEWERSFRWQAATKWRHVFIFVLFIGISSGGNGCWCWKTSLNK